MTDPSARGFTTNRILYFVLVLAMAIGTLALPESDPAAAAGFSVRVVSARTEPNADIGAVMKGDLVRDFKFIINIDDTGTTEQRTPSDGCSPDVAGYPSTCNWVSIAGVPTGSSPIYTQGVQIIDPGNSAHVITDLPGQLPAGKYLISVLADGYKLDGVHFTVPETGATEVVVELQPTPLPPATIQAAVFEDISPVNGAPDLPAEHGLAGFQGHIADYLGEVTTDVFGNPLGAEYDANGEYIAGTGGVVLSKCYVVANGVDVGTITPGAGGRCPSSTNGINTTIEGNPIPAGAVVEGKLIIPNLGPNRYALSIVAPDGTSWIQTTTLEGNHDWDAWVMEGATGLDTEFVLAGEPFPAIIFGYVSPTGSLPAGSTGHIKGVVGAARVYVPPKGGTGLPGTIWGGAEGMAIDETIEYPWITLTDLNAGDTMVYAGKGDANGAFDIANVPDGNYTITWWDEPQNYILDLLQVTVSNGETVDMGILPSTGWWTHLEGFVFNDLNRNGRKDPGEKGLSNYTLTMRKRENSLMDRGATAVTTDANGFYVMENTYPMTQWLVMEAYNDLFYTTGVTYQADNQPEPTTIIGAGVDISVLPIIGLGGRIDWGVHTYDPAGLNGVDPRNGGIVGTVSYDTTRNELDARYAFVEDWQPGIPGLTVNLYDTIECTVASAACDPSDSYELDTDGSYKKGQLLNSALTEQWERPVDCVARDVDGNPLVAGADENVLPTTAGSDCLEGPLMGVQVATYQTDQGTPDANFGAAVDGNYGFGDGCYGDGGFDPIAEACADETDPRPLDGGHEYLVEVEIPNDALGRPLFEVTREEDINIGNGDSFVPLVPPPACAGPLHTVDVAGIEPDGLNATVNETFAELGGSPYEGMEMPLCDTKLVQLNNGKSIVPTFNLFTQVPLPGRMWGLLVDDLNFSANPQSLLYGEKAGIAFAPVGIYDYTNRLVTTVESDYNGLFDVLLPSTNRISCPTPSGVCANLYRFVGNDPGTPGRLNLNFKPQFRTIAAEFEALPGLIVPADLAPTQVGVTVQLPGGQFSQISCPVDPATPQLFAVSTPIADKRDSVPDTFTIAGQGFGTTTGQVTLNGMALPTSAWTNTSISVTVPDATAVGPQQLKITATNGQSTTNGLTFHVLGFTAFPATGVLDNFNRNGIGSNWSAGNIFALDSNEVLVAQPLNSQPATGSGTMRWTGITGGGPVYGANQEAFFTFVKVGPIATEQGLFLKISGNGNNPNPTATPSAYIEASYKATNPSSVQVRTKANGTNTVVLQATFPTAFAATDTLGARALANGTVIAYKNGVEIGRVNVTTTTTPWPAANASGGGRLGVRFVGVGKTSTDNFARFDNFGGGNLVGYLPNVYEVGPGRTYAPANTLPDVANHAIQDALDAAAASAGDDLVVVYPGVAAAERVNPRGAYYENLIVTTPVKLQGVGPGSPDGSIPGSIIDGGAFGGDSAVFGDWLDTIAGTEWDGNQTINDGAIISIFTRDGAFTDAFTGTIDGFDLRGGNQGGFPGNINNIGGLPTGLPGGLTTQGGAIFANGFARNLQITNNIVQNNGGAYGTIRIGNPDLPAPDTDGQNDDVRIANNRIIANGGTNLAGAIGLFAGSDHYEVSRNDICGNFSAEYGGGVSVYGFSPFGSIHHNRIFYNASYDEGGGIMIAGQLPADPTTLSPGSGPVGIYNNLIQANLANDDGGGIRFLMAGKATMSVFNNMIVNNVSTHEGGGIGINDTSDVRVYNNTIMKNLTTATAVTSTGYRAPAGLSTSQNSDVLQASLPVTAPIFSNPLLFNNIFWDNRAGTRAGGAVTGLTDTDADVWDLGVADATGTLTSTNSIIQAGDGGPMGSDPLVVETYDVSVGFNVWRNNPNFVGAILVLVEAPPNLLGNYHLTDESSAAVDLGTPTGAPSFDFDDQTRIGNPDIGADEYVVAQ